MRIARYFPLLGLLAGCITPYKPNIGYPKTGYLVVEGNLNMNQPTLIQLSRTTAISDTIGKLFETGATVQVQGSDGSSVTLPELDTGRYYVNTLPLDSAVSYRIFITTSNGESYASEYVRVITTPAIDSAYGILDNDGMHIYVASHNAQNSTHYYQYAYQETWQYRSQDSSEYYWDVASQEAVQRTPAQQVYDCWRSDSSTTALIYSTANLEQDVADDQLTLISLHDQRLSLLYTIQVNEYGVSDSDYSYLVQLQTSTESLGTIFSPTPTALIGNIHSISNPSEQVMGFINASSVSTYRLWITSPPNWNLPVICPADSIVTRYYQYYFQGIRPQPFPNFFDPLCCLYVPLYPDQASGIVANTQECVDCTAQGGVNVKPSFWP